MSRTAFVAGNWKMNLGPSAAAELARAMHDRFGSTSIDVAVGPVALSLPAVCDALANSGIGVAAQNMYPATSGAYTGELSPTMLTEVGCRYVILGHSERRQYFAESDDFVNEKVKSAIAHDLSPIVCVGESLEQRESGQTGAVVDRQVRGALRGVRSEDMGVVTIAYEPIWAIGTGRTASPEQAQEVHAQIRTLLRALYSQEVANALRIQYGGSVKPANIVDLWAQPDIDGALVGGASLKVDSFAAIVEACAD